MTCLQVGKWRGCINVPLINSSWKYNAETRKKEVVKEDNLDFIAQVGMVLFAVLFLGTATVRSTQARVVKGPNLDFIARVPVPRLS